jgi:hypothetical protein
MSGSRRRTANLTVRLARLEDLFRTPEPDLFPTTGRLVSGVDELLTQLQGMRIPKRVSTTIVLEHDAGAGEEARIGDLIHRYCDLRLRDLESRLRSQRRQQRHSLLVGLLLFVIGVALASEFAASYWPAEVKSLLGDGIFLVVAWVGLWYPLDYLVFGRRPLLEERKALHALGAAEVKLQPEPHAGQTTPARLATT